MCDIVSARDANREGSCVGLVGRCRTVILANLEVADKLQVAFLLSIPMVALLGCVGGGFHGVFSPANGASA